MAKWAIVSPRAPNGVTFLLNIFLELDILIYRILHPGDGPYSRTWDKQGWKFVVQEGEFNALKTQLPSLREKTVYSFEKGVEVLWDHAQDLVHYADFNLLVLTRDPRDSLFSWFRRQKSLGDIPEDCSFADFLELPSRLFPNLYNALHKRVAQDGRLVFRDFWFDNSDRFIENRFGTHIDEQMAAYECYLARWDKPGELLTQVARFEDLKASPLSFVKNLLNIMGVDRELVDIARAIENSQLNVAKNTELLHGGSLKINHKGMSYEWKSNPEQEQAYKKITEQMQPLLDVLSY